MVGLVSKELALQHLQQMFPGRLVLYAPDVAKILGISQRALAHLIERDRFPFSVKMVGNKRCVDIFQVAAWLASGNGMPDQQGGESVKSARNNGRKTPADKSRPKISAQGSMVQTLIGLRRGAAARVTQLAVSINNDIETPFWTDVAECLALFELFIEQSFSVKVKIGNRDGLVSEDRVVNFPNLDEALSFARKTMGSLASHPVASITVRSSGKKVFKAMKMDHWVTVLDKTLPS